jgi:hypothetical protein
MLRRNWRLVVPEHVSPHARDLLMQLMQPEASRRLPLLGVLSHPFLTYPFFINIIFLYFLFLLLYSLFFPFFSLSFIFFETIQIYPLALPTNISS